MDSLFGGEMTGAARFIIAFIVVLALIAVAAWLVRRFGTGSLSSGAARGRQPRLAVIDAASVDARRRLLLVRRDNIEHLVMIGGPTDIVIEQNIVRGTAVAPRDIAASARPAQIADAIPRAVSLDDSAGWPLPPQPELGVRGPRPVEPQMPWPMASHPAPEPGPQPAAPAPQAIRPEALADLADAVAAAAPPPAPPSPPQAMEPEPHHPEPHPEPPPARQYATPATDQNLAAMAQRLEAALRRGPGGGEPRLDIPVTEAPPAAQPAPAVHAPDVHPPQGTQQGAPPRKFYETLEQEMASLLGRSTGKT